MAWPRILTCLLALTSSAASIGAPTYYSEPPVGGVLCGKEYTTHDLWYQAPGVSSYSSDLTLKRNACDGAFQQQARADFHMNDWGGQWSQNGTCHIDSPIFRFFNGLWILKNAAKDSDSRNYSILNWGYDWSRKQMDKTEPFCTNDPKLAAKFERDKKFPSFSYEYTMKISQNSLNGGTTPLGRAGIVIHEARHHQKGHNASDSSCSSGGSCDSHWEYYGANTYETLWQWWFAVDSSPLFTDRTRERAADNANTYMDFKFRDAPNTPHIVPSTAKQPLKVKTSGGYGNPKAPIYINATCTRSNVEYKTVVPQLVAQNIPALQQYCGSCGIKTFSKNRGSTITLACGLGQIAPPETYDFIPPDDIQPW